MTTIKLTPDQFRVWTDLKNIQKSSLDQYKVSFEKKKQIVDLWNRGYFVCQISRDVKLSQSIVQQVIRQYKNGDL